MYATYRAGQQCPEAMQLRGHVWLKSSMALAGRCKSDMFATAHRATPPLWGAAPLQLQPVVDV